MDFNRVIYGDWQRGAPVSKAEGSKGYIKPEQSSRGGGRKPLQ